MEMFERIKNIALKQRYKKAPENTNDIVFETYFGDRYFG
jgi:hypothetical protein